MSAVCPACGGAMDGRSCRPLAWRVADGPMARIPYGQETSGLSRPCRDCGTPIGGYHHPECCVELCPHGQAISCDAGVCELVLREDARA